MHVYALLGFHNNYICIASYSGGLLLQVIKRGRLEMRHAVYPVRLFVRIVNVSIQ